MRLVIQRVSKASVSVDSQCIGQIGTGLMVLVGVGKEDTKDTVKRYVEKMLKLRIFSDENEKTNLSLQDVSGELLVISQFTLYADCKKGNRPNFMQAGSPQLGEELYEYFITLCKEHISNVQCGQFGAHMEVSLTNNGPFTIVLDCLD